MTTEKWKRREKKLLKKEDWNANVWTEHLHDPGNSEEKGRSNKKGEKDESKS